MKRSIFELESELEHVEKLKKYSTKICVTGMRTKIPRVNDDDVLVINCTSRSKIKKWRQFSPFFLGPVEIPVGMINKLDQGVMISKTHENAWQYAKVYARHTDTQDNPTLEYWKWAEKGWKNPKAVRFPMGKGRIPQYSIWNGKKLGYVEARKEIYAPTYSKLVMETDAFRDLKEIMNSGKYKVIWLRDFDGYDNTSLGKTLKEVVNNPKRKMGHAFVLAGCLTNNTFWE